jgi:hypothetical protein
VIEEAAKRHISKDGKGMDERRTPWAQSGNQTLSAGLSPFTLQSLETPGSLGDL